MSSVSRRSNCGSAKLNNILFASPPTLDEGGASLARVRSTAALRGGRSSRTVFHMTGNSTASYWWRSQLPIPLISAQGGPGQRSSASWPSRIAASLITSSLRSTAAMVLGSSENQADRVRNVAKGSAEISKRRSLPRELRVPGCHPSAPAREPGPLWLPVCLRGGSQAAPGPATNTHGRSRNRQ